MLRYLPPSASSWSRPSASGRRAEPQREQRAATAARRRRRRLLFGAVETALAAAGGAWWLAWTRTEAAGPPPQPQRPRLRAGERAGGDSPCPPRWPTSCFQLEGLRGPPGSRGSARGLRPSGRRLWRPWMKGQRSLPFAIFFLPPPLADLPPSLGASASLGEKKTEERWGGSKGNRD